VRYWPPNEAVFPFGGSYVCVNFGENWSKNATVRVPTDGHTHWRLTDANRFYNLSHAICYRTDKNRLVAYLTALFTGTLRVTLLYYGGERFALILVVEADINQVFALHVTPKVPGRPLSGVMRRGTGEELHGDGQEVMIYWRRSATLRWM